MPSFQDSAVIFFIALLLFGPKKLPELARQLGKLMAEFRRASNEFRMQMDDELRQADEEERRKKIAAMEAAAPVTPALTEGHTETVVEASTATSDVIPDAVEGYSHAPAEAMEAPVGEMAPLPIASSGDLKMMPPSTGLPVSSSPLSPMSSSLLSPMIEAIPQSEGAETVTEATHHG